MRRLAGADARKKISEPRRRVTRRRVFVAVLLLLSVDTVIWTFACRQLEQALPPTALEQGWEVAAQRTHWSGWPFEAAVVLEDASGRSVALPGFVLQAEQARVSLALTHPTTLAIALAGSQSVTFAGSPTVPFTADRNVITVDLRGATPTVVSIAGLRATAPAGVVTVARAAIDLPPDGVAAELDQLTWPGVPAPVESLRLRARIAPAPGAVASAQAWRRAGGLITIETASVRWDRLDATGSGTIGLDDRLQPVAEGVIEAAGLPSLLDDLARLGAIAPAQAGAAKAVIAVLAAPSGGSRVQLPVAASDGIVRIARFPLLRFPPLALD